MKQEGPCVDYMLKLGDGNTEVSYTNSLYLHIYVKVSIGRILKRRVTVISNYSFLAPAPPQGT